MSRPASIEVALRHALARPRTAAWVLQARKLELFIRLTDGLTHRQQRAVGRILRILARPLLARSPVTRLGVTLEALGLQWTAGRALALAYANEIARHPRVDAATLMRLARLCFEVGEPVAASGLLDRLPTGPDEATASIAMRADIDWRLGRYRSAVEHAQRVLARRPDDEFARRIRDRAGAELIVLEPGWRPRLGPRKDQVAIRGRILHLLTNSLPYRQAGYTVRAQQLARAQIEVGLDPHMATRAGFPGNAGIRHAAASAVIEGVTYHRVLPDLDTGIGPDRVISLNASAAQELVETLQPAVLHPTTDHVNAQIALALRDRYGIPIVYEVRGFLEETWLSRRGSVGADSDRYLASREVETACMRAADAIVTLSETMRQDILGRNGIDPESVVVVPNAVDVERFVPGPRQEALAAHLGLGTAPVIGYISSFTVYEGIGHLISATAELRRRRRRVRCLLVGDGEARPDLEAQARAAGLLADGTVIFTGRVPYSAILDYYRLIDVFVVPRTADRVSQLVTPLKPYEAMAMERAIVVSGVGALLEVVTEGETGRSFTPEDPINLADVLEPLLDDPAQRARLGAAARAWVAENRTWSLNGVRYLELYRRLGVA